MWSFALIIVPIAHLQLPAQCAKTDTISQVVPALPVLGIVKHVLAVIPLNINAILVDLAITYRHHPKHANRAHLNV